ncbi:MAG: hypothetical protein ACYSN9_04610, partial [Planctomycetota bacterium]
PANNASIYLGAHDPGLKHPRQKDSSKKGLTMQTYKAKNIKDVFFRFTDSMSWARLIDSNFAIGQRK